MLINLLIQHLLKLINCIESHQNTLRYLEYSHKIISNTLFVYESFNPRLKLSPPTKTFKFISTLLAFFMMLTSSCDSGGKKLSIIYDICPFSFSDET